MTMILAAGAAYEFGNVSALDVTPGRYDEDYSLGAVTRLSSSSYASIFFNSTLAEIWVHAKVLFGDLASPVGDTPVISLHSPNGVFVGGLYRNHMSYLLSAKDMNQNVNITGVLTRNTLVDVDMHLLSFGTSKICELYIDGVMIAKHTVTSSWVAPGEIRFGGSNGSETSFSEIIITQGNEPTLGWRLHSKLPDAALPGLNTFDSGFWGALGNGSLIDGAVTESADARITGGFQAYTGPASPLGIRGIMQTGRFLKNGTLLTLGGQLRIDDVNYDSPTLEIKDSSRIFSFWEQNPATSAPFVVADFAGLQGGFYTEIGD
jgi:hypothetical protein